MLCKKFFGRFLMIKLLENLDYLFRKFLYVDIARIGGFPGILDMGRSSYIPSWPLRFSLSMVVKEVVNPSAAMLQSSSPLQLLRKRKSSVRNSSMTCWYWNVPWYTVTLSGSCQHLLKTLYERPANKSQELNWGKTLFFRCWEKGIRNQATAIEKFWRRPGTSGSEIGC